MTIMSYRFSRNYKQLSGKISLVSQHPTLWFSAFPTSIVSPACWWELQTCQQAAELLPIMWLHIKWCHIQMSSTVLQSAHGHRRVLLLRSLVLRPHTVNDLSGTLQSVLPSTNLHVYTLNCLNGFIQSSVWNVFATCVFSSFLLEPTHRVLPCTFSGFSSRTCK